jgi:hypothetical protein
MKTKLFYLLLFFPLVLLGQNNTYNWVKQITYKKNTPSTIVSPSVEDATINITYLDGLGRPIQQNAYQQSGSNSGKDIITHLAYDGFGRQVTNYLPVVSTSNDMDFVAEPQIQTLLSQQYAGQNAYSEKEFEASPLNRVFKIAAPGDATNWAMGSGHEIEMQYQTNTIADDVRHYTTTTGIDLLDTGKYNDNELYKTIVIDENGNTTHQFKNTKGQLILKRSFLNGAINTYYVYDQFDNLAFVMPPKATDTQQTTIDNLCYQYHYDDKNRLVEKKTPGKQWEYIVYDALNRIVATGPAYNPFGGDDTKMGWLYSRYDNQNRVVLTGWFADKFTAEDSYNYRNTDLRKSLQNNYIGEVINSDKTTTLSNFEGFYVAYTTNELPFGMLLLTVNYYDSYDFPTPVSIAFDSPFGLAYYNLSRKPKGLPTGSWVRTLITETGPITGETSYILYNYRGQPITTHQFNFLGGSTRTMLQVDFTGKTTFSKTVHFYDTQAHQLTIDQEFTYTNQGQLAQERHKINNGSWRILSDNQYTNLGRLTSKKTGGITAFDYMQKIDYNYNIRGWLTGINTVNNLIAAGEPDDLFAFEIKYDQVDGIITGATGYFNGNISEIFCERIPTTPSENIVISTIRSIG